MKGDCSRGKKCGFGHPQQCKAHAKFVQTGNQADKCKRGVKCGFLHYNPAAKKRAAAAKAKPKGKAKARAKSKGNTPRGKKAAVAVSQDGTIDIQSVLDEAAEAEDYDPETDVDQTSEGAAEPDYEFEECQWCYEPEYSCQCEYEAPNALATEPEWDEESQAWWQFDFVADRWDWFLDDEDDYEAYDDEYDDESPLDQ